MSQWNPGKAGAAGYVLIFLILLPNLFIVARFGLVSLVAMAFGYFALASVSHPIHDSFLERLGEWHGRPLLVVIVALSAVAFYAYFCSIRRAPALGRC